MNNLYNLKLLIDLHDQKYILDIILNLILKSMIHLIIQVT